ncbi:hypothetical protein D3C71_1223950 [compost metagenome]
MERHALGEQVLIDGTTFLHRHLIGGEIQCRLRQALLEDAERHQEFIRHDGIVHTHAALVENAEDDLVGAEVAGDLLRQILEILRHLACLKRRHMARVMVDRTFQKPLGKTAAEEIVVECLAPQRGIGDTRLGQRAVEIEQADQTRPLAGPVGNGQDRSLVAGETGQHMVRILPDGFCDDHRHIGIDLRKRIHALALRGEKAVAFFRLVGVSALHRVAEAGEHLAEFLLHRILGRPALLVGGQAKVAAGEKCNLFGHVPHPSNQYSAPAISAA